LDLLNPLLELLTRAIRPVGAVTPLTLLLSFATLRTFRALGTIGAVPALATGRLQLLTQLLPLLLSQYRENLFAQVAQQGARCLHHGFAIPGMPLAGGCQLTLELAENFIDPASLLCGEVQ